MRKILDLSRRRFVPVALVVLAACYPGGDVGKGAASEAASTSSTIEVVDFPGLEAALAKLDGEGALVNFWAMWCPPCVAELPELVEVAREYEGRGGRVVGVSYDLMVAGSDRATIEAETRDFLAARGLDLAVLIYDESDYDAINERFGLPGEVPVTLAIDKTGAIVDREEGRAGKARFEELMRKALGL